LGVHPAIPLLKMLSVLLWGFNQGKWLSGAYKERASSTLRNMHRAERLMEVLTKEPGFENGVYYSYWLAEWALILGLLAKRFPDSSTLISRAHGFDLYDHRDDLSLRVNKSFILHKIDHVYTVSDQGANYLKSNYKRYRHKISRSYLGTILEDKQVPASEPSEFTIATCARLVPLKRIHLLIEALSHIKEPVRWVHHGGGELEEELILLSKSLPKNINVVWKGDVSNKNIHNFYASETVDVFILLSSTEGLPMSIMEAQSYGIPTVATNVGGVAEIVNDKTGYLLDRDFEVNQLVTTLQNLIDKELTYDSNTIRTHWKEKFSVQNYVSLADTIGPIKRID